MTAAVLLAFLALAPRCAQAGASKTAELDLIEDSPVRLSITLDGPLNRLLKLHPSTGTLEDVQIIPSYYAGPDFRFRIPGQAGGRNPRFDAAALESPSEIAFVYPPIPSLISGLCEAAADTESYKTPWTVRLATRTVHAMQAVDPDGNALVSILLDPRSENALWHDSVAMVDHVQWEGQDVTILLVGKVYGGLGRLSAALRARRGREPSLGLARGELFSSLLPELKGPALAEALEKMGLSYSAVSNSELAHWADLQAYRSAHPDGVQFLSSNLVYSTAPAQAVFPREAFATLGGLRLALIGLTPPYAARSLGTPGLPRLEISNPVAALEQLLPSVRARADAVIVLANVDEELERQLVHVRGVDLVLGQSEARPAGAAPPENTARQSGRPVYDKPLAVVPAYVAALNSVELSLSASSAGADWTVAERHAVLADENQETPGLPEFDPRDYGITLSTEPAVIPDPRLIFPDSPDAAPTVSARDFWTLAAGVLARQTRSEAGLLPVWSLPIEMGTQVREGVARVWLGREEPAVAVWLKGSELKGLLAEQAAQKEKEDKQQRWVGRLRFTAGGIEPGPKIHGEPIQDQNLYRVATSRVLADAFGLSANHPLLPLGKNVGQLVMDGLTRREGSPPADYRKWMSGEPLSDGGLWRINFRDVGLNIQNTDVVASDAFNNVPNSRVQGFNQLLIGGDVKTDADYLQGPFKWSNTLEMEYAKSELRPRDQPAITNLAANRISLLTTGTRRAGTIDAKWLASSWGPSVGVEYDTQFEAQNGLPLRNFISAYPGVQLYDGSWLRSVEASGVILRDQSRTPPNTQYGLHTRWLLTHTTGGPAPVTLNGEFFANYYFLTHEDTNQDLRFESDADLKLQFPIRKYLSISPFIDFYSFALKTQPVWGYSCMTGISINFSRLWKPQFEPF